MRSYRPERCFATAGLLAAALMACAPGQARAQAAQQPAAFDAASIRKNVDNIGVCRPDQVQPTPSGFRLTNCPLIVALGTAYVPTTGDALGFVIGMGDRIVGMPDWMTADRYDIVARIGDADAEAWKDPVRQKILLHEMLRTLLADRCKLVVHREMKDKPIFAIVVGKSGPKLTPAETSGPDALHEKYPDGMAVPGAGGTIRSGENGSRHLYGATIGTLALVLAYPAGRPVVDKTGLTGRFDIALPRMQNAGDDNTAADGVPTIFTVVEKLGLKLEPQKDPVEMLVIDHVERPSEN